MDLDLELLASIASGGLGSWQTDAAGRSLYVKSDDCIGAQGWGTAPGVRGEQPVTALPLPPPSQCCLLLPAL